MSTSSPTTRSSTRVAARRAIEVACVCAAFAAAFLVVSGRLALSVSVQWPGGEERYRPHPPGGAGEELVLAYVGASTCGASNAPQLPAIVERTKLAVLRQARARQQRLVVVGIAKDALAAPALAHLRKFGEFDEIAAGNGWFNNAAHRYGILFPGLVATPQIVLTHRAVADADGQRRILDERLLVRKVGLSEISTWAALGAPIPARQSTDAANGR